MNIPRTRSRERSRGSRETLIRDSLVCLVENPRSVDRASGSTHEVARSRVRGQLCVSRDIRESCYTRARVRLTVVPVYHYQAYGARAYLMRAAGISPSDAITFSRAFYLEESSGGRLDLISAIVGRRHRHRVLVANAPSSPSLSLQPVVVRADNTRGSRKRVLKPETVTIVYGRASSEDFIDVGARARDRARVINRPRLKFSLRPSRSRASPICIVRSLAWSRIRRVAVAPTENRASARGRRQR